ncbi:MAG: hypothetical protein VR73_08135 [Gammaproteobacteria bacterium BRH_c0]|nr:MAG: hypothetical protein VR73_08135 [Gammaproteobacteria bacterium BRH_c0]
MNAGKPCSQGDAALKLTFYIAGSGFFSRAARANLDALVAELGAGTDIEVEIVDVTQAPEVALAKGIFTTPALIANLGSAQLRFIGDLSQREKVLGALRQAL